MRLGHLHSKREVVNCKVLSVKLESFWWQIYNYTSFQVWLPARAFVEDAIKEAHNVDDSGEIIVLKKSCPWKEHLYELEKELKVKIPLKYCLYEVGLLSYDQWYSASVSPGKVFSAGSALILHSEHSLVPCQLNCQTSFPSSLVHTGSELCHDVPAHPSLAWNLHMAAGHQWSLPGSSCGSPRKLWEQITTACFLERLARWSAVRSNSDSWMRFCTCFRLYWGKQKLSWSLGHGQASIRIGSYLTSAYLRLYKLMTKTVKYSR